MTKTSTQNWREARRMQALELHEKGWSQKRIAKELGVTQGAVSQWLKRYRDGGGVEALRHHPSPGRQSVLSHEELAEIPDLILCGAKAFGFPDNRWTIQRITILLKQVFDVSYHPGHVSRLLQKHCPEWRNFQRK